METITIIILLLALIFDLILFPLHERDKNTSQSKYKPNKPQSNPYMDLRLKHGDDEDPQDEYI